MPTDLADTFADALLQLLGVHLSGDPNRRLTQDEWFYTECCTRYLDLGKAVMSGVVEQRTQEEVKKNKDRITRLGSQAEMVNEVRRLNNVVMKSLFVDGLRESDIGPLKSGEPIELIEMALNRADTVSKALGFSFDRRIYDQLRDVLKARQQLRDAVTDLSTVQIGTLRFVKERKWDFPTENEKVREYNVVAQTELFYCLKARLEALVKTCLFTDLEIPLPAFVVFCSLYGECFHKDAVQGVADKVCHVQFDEERMKKRKIALSRGQKLNTIAKGPREDILKRRSLDVAELDWGICWSAGSSGDVMGALIAGLEQGNLASFFAALVSGKEKLDKTGGPLALAQLQKSGSPSGGGSGSILKNLFCRFRK